MERADTDNAFDTVRFFQKLPLLYSWEAYVPGTLCIVLEIPARRQPNTRHRNSCNNILTDHCKGELMVSFLQSCEETKANDGYAHSFMCVLSVTAATLQAQS